MNKVSRETFADAQTREISAILLVVAMAFPVLFLQVGAFGSDMVGYLERARLLIANGNFTALGFRPMYHGLFALSYLLLGVSASSALWVTKTALFTSILLLYLIVKRLYDIKTGLIAVALVVTSAYMMGFPSHFAVDQTMAFFMLLSLYLMLRGFASAGFGVGLAAGMALAAGVLVKEIAIIWLVLPFYLFGGITSWRRRENFKVLIGFTTGFLLLLGGWLLLLFRLGEGVGKWDLYRGLWRRSQKMLEQWLGVLEKWRVAWHIPSLTPRILIVFLVFVVILIAWLYARRKTAKVRKGAGIGRFLAGAWFFLLWLVVTAVLVEVLTSMWNWPVTTMASLGDRLLGFVEFTRMPETGLTLFPFFLVALVIVLLDAFIPRRRSGLVVIWLLMSLVPIMMVPLPLKPRYGMILYWVVYMILARALAVVVEGAGRLFPGSESLKHGVVFAGVTFFVVWGMWHSWQFPFVYPYHSSSYYSYIDENAPAVNETARWLRTNIPSSAKLAGVSLYRGTLTFFGNGTYTIDTLGNAFYPLSGLRLVEGSPKFYAPGIQQVGVPMYLQQGLGKWNYLYGVLSEQSLVDFIQDSDVDYLILPEFPGFYRALHLMPDYFSDSPAFRCVYSTRWQDRGKTVSLHVIQVDRSLLQYSNYPVIVTTGAWSRLLKDVTQKTGDSSGTYKIVSDLFGGSPIVFRPASPTNFENYNRLAEADISQDRWGRAAFEYHLALSKMSYSPGWLLTLAEQGTTAHPEIAATWLLLGDVREKLGDREKAREAYERALAAEEIDALTATAAQAALGDYYFSGRQYDLALRHFEQSLDQHIFAASTTRLKRLYALAAVYQSRGENSQAIRAYQEAVYSDPQAVVDAYFARSQSVGGDIVAPNAPALLRETFDLTAQESERVLEQPRLNQALLDWYKALDSPEGLVMVYEKILRQKPDDAGTWAALADAYERLGRSEGAIAAYEKAIALDPTLVSAYTHLGNLYVQQGDTDQAFAIFQKAVMAFSHDPHPHIALANFYLSRASELKSP